MLRDPHTDPPAVAARSGPVVPSAVRWAGRLAPSLAALALGGCAAGPLGDPRAAALEYAEAAERGDADALYAMLSESSQRRVVLAEARAKVEEQREELRERAQAIRDPATKVETEARLRFGDGEHARLRFEDGEFRVTAADALPALARTPVDALEELRRVLARRSYAGLVRVLSARTRAALESDLRSLVDGLEDPEGLEVIEVSSDRAVVVVPGGHRVELRREGGSWRVDDFD